MSAWKRVALEKLPEYRRVIEVAKTPMELWIDLYLKFELVYYAEILDDDLICRFYDYAGWCLESPGDGSYSSNAETAVCHAFFGHLPLNGVIRRDMRRWLSPQDFFGLREIFHYHLSKEQFAVFEAEFIG